MLKKHNIDPNHISGSGERGRIVKEDILNFLKDGKSQQKEEKAIKAQPPKPDTSNNQKSVTSTEDKVMKIAGFQKAMNKTMSQSTSIPSFLFTDEYNVDTLVKLRKEMNKSSKDDFKISFMPFLIKAVSLGLLRYPILNSTVNSNLGDDGLIYEYTIKKDHNISVAIDSPEGLVVPNIKKVQEKSIAQIQKDLYDLRDKTLKKKLTSEDLKDGTFTVSNIGNIGGKVLSPVIMPPQSCIIGISKIFDSITVMPQNKVHEDSQVYHLVENKDLAVVFHKTLNICISADHRILDGATVARFSESVKAYVENPLKIWLEH